MSKLVLEVMVGALVAGVLLFFVVGKPLLQRWILPWLEREKRNIDIIQSREAETERFREEARKEAEEIVRRDY